MEFVHLFITFLGETIEINIVFASSILNTHLDITVTLHSAVIAKGIFVSWS